MLKNNKIKHICPIFIILFFFFLNSCQMSRKSDIKKIIQEWQEKEILIPAEIEYKTLGQNTVNSALWNSPYKILTYIDSIGCSSCQLRFSEWEILINSCKLQKLDVSFLFVVHSSDFINFDKEIRFYGFDYPIIFDYKNQFDKFNHFPPAPYRTFLLDKDNKVQLIGSPINNPTMWELYKKEITHP